MKFDGSSTAMVVLRGKDMRGKTALVTGGNSGLGMCNNLIVMVFQIVTFNLEKKICYEKVWIHRRFVRKRNEPELLFPFFRNQS